MSVLFGYYFARGRYGEYPPLVTPSGRSIDEFTNVDLLSPFHFFFDSSEYPTPQVMFDRLRLAARRALSLDRKIFLGLDMADLAPLGIPWQTVISTVSQPFPELQNRSAWDVVEIIELTGEPGWPEAVQASNAAAVRAHISSLGLAAKPLGAVFAYTHAIALVSVAFDWVGLEAYLDPPGTQFSPATIKSAVRSQIAFQSGRLRPGHDVLVVMMAYNRNGAWTAEDLFPDLQRGTVEASQEFFGPPPLANDLLGFALFSYARPGGTHDLLGEGGNVFGHWLESIHQEIAAALGIGGTTTPPPTDDCPP